MIDGGKERDILSTQDEILTMVKRINENQARFEEHVNSRLDKMQKTIIGNGENERAILPRMRVIEDRQQIVLGRLAENEQDIHKLELFQEAWRNRVIGMAMLVPITVTIAIALTAYFISLALQ